MPEQTTENLAAMIKIFWDTLQIPSWSSNDLIDLGKAIYAKKRLNALDDDLFHRMLPHLKTMVIHLQSKMTILDKPYVEKSPLPPSGDNSIPDLPKELP